MFVVIGALLVAGAGLAWVMFGGEETAAVNTESLPEPSQFRCKVCGEISPTFKDAYEHVSADHNLVGKKIDESVEGIS